MQQEKLKKIQESIRKNWGKVKPFNKIPIYNFNCYMFAICNTEPTEILFNGRMMVSTVGEYVSYFGSIGRFSRTSYKNLEQYKQALINDLRVLGILAEECEADAEIDKEQIKIAFFSNFEEGMPKAEEEFHFLRFVPTENRWMGKEGYPGNLQRIRRGCSIEQINVVGQRRIGIFKLTLI